MLFSRIFHTASKSHADSQGKRIPLDSEKWPSAWKTTFYKDYGRLPQVALPPALWSHPFSSLITARSSQRNFRGNSLSSTDLSRILKYSCGEIGISPDGRVKRAQPSAGARFPIETYIFMLRSTEEIRSGIYHYAVPHHALDRIAARDFSSADCNSLFLYPWAKDAAIIIVLTGVFNRTQGKYGERGYRYILLEAGHIGQNVYLASQALGYKCCGLGGTVDRSLEELLSIDGQTESVLYALVIGN